MAKIPFTVSARTAKLIGQENFANAEGAIIELVKNAYDADADTAIIIFDTSKSEHCIYIIDNGHGMTEQVIKEKWMQIGTDDKLQNFTSDGGRIKTGAKGIGRFALDRLGTSARMHTVSKFDKQSLYWFVNWEDFNEIGLAINEVKAKLFDFKSFNLVNHLRKYSLTMSKYLSLLKKLILKQRKEFISQILPAVFRFFNFPQPRRDAPDAAAIQLAVSVKARRFAVISLRRR